MKHFNVSKQKGGFFYITGKVEFLDDQKHAREGKRVFRNMKQTKLDQIKQFLQNFFLFPTSRLFCLWIK